MFLLTLVSWPWRHRGARAASFRVVALQAEQRADLEGLGVQGGADPARDARWGERGYSDPASPSPAGRFVRTPEVGRRVPIPGPGFRATPARRAEPCTRFSASIVLIGRNAPSAIELRGQHGGAGVTDPVADPFQGEKMRYRRMLAAAVAATAVGCGSGGGPGALNTAAYWPLHTGDQWTYRVRRPTGATQTIRAEIASETAIGGRRVIPHRQTVGDAVQAVFYFEADTAGGLKLAAVDSGPPAEASHVFTPSFEFGLVLPGRTRSQRVQARGAGAAAAADAATLDVTFHGFEDASTPAGLFRDCLKITTRHAVLDAGGARLSFGRSTTRTMHLAPGLGLVRVVDGDGAIAELMAARVGGRTLP